MSRTTEQKIKLLVLYNLLCEKTDEEHPMNSDGIISELSKKGIDVASKVLVKDIETLNNFGYEILSFKKKYNYYYVVNRPFDTAEVVMLSDAIKSSKLTATQKQQLIGKLAKTLCSYQAEKISNNIISFDKDKQFNSCIIYNVDSIDRAINENKQISFKYFDFDEKHKKVYRHNGEKYIVSPISMVWNNDKYYLLCYKQNHDNIGTYRIDKMEDVSIEENQREPHNKYDVFNSEEYRKQVFSMFGGELKKVKLNFTQNMLNDIFDKFGSEIKIYKTKNNTYQTIVEVQTSRTFYSWIVGTQGKVKILEPKNVLNDFNEFVDKIKSEY